MGTLCKAFARYRARVGTVALTHIVLNLLDQPFDNVLYPAVLLWQGPFVGAGIMMVLALLANLAYMHIYVRIGEDWLGVNAVESFKQSGHVWVERLYARPHTFFGWVLKVLAWLPTRAYLFVLWALRKNDVTAFFALSIFQDAFRTTAFLRHGRVGPMSAHDWRVFYASIMVSNIYWSFRWTLIIEAARWLLTTYL